MLTEFNIDAPCTENSPPQDRKAVRPLKIALLGYRSHPHVGGQGIYLKYVSRALTQLGHSVDVLSGPPYPELDGDVRLIKIPSLDLYSVFPNHIGAFKFKYLLSWTDFSEWWTMASGGFGEPYSFGRRVAKWLVQHSDYDIVHDNQSLNYGLLQLQKRGVPIVATVHHPITRDRDLAVTEAPDWGRKLLVKRWYSFIAMQRSVVRKLHHVITVSETSMKDIEVAFQCDPRRLEVIPNGVDVSVFRPSADINAIPFRLLTTTSSDQPLKGFASLLTALAELKEYFPDVHLRVVGQLKPGGANENLIQKLQLQNHISFCSQLSDEQLRQEYALAHVAVCPSLYEGFGLPVLEAMACGVPLVSSDGGALAEVVGDGGLIYPAGNAKALAMQIGRVLKDAALADNLRVRGRQRVLQCYSWSQVGQRLTDYYYRVLSVA